MTSMCQCCSSWAECPSPTLMTSMTTTGDAAALELRYWTSTTWAECPSPTLMTSMTTTGDAAALELRYWTLSTSAPRRLPCHLVAGFVGTWLVRSGTTPSATNTTVTILVRSPSHDYDAVNKWNEKCNDLKCVQKPTQSRLSLTHHANKSSRCGASLTSDTKTDPTCT